MFGNPLFYFTISPNYFWLLASLTQILEHVTDMVRSRDQKARWEKGPQLTKSYATQTFSLTRRLVAQHHPSCQVHSFSVFKALLSDGPASAVTFRTALLFHYYLFHVMLTTRGGDGLS